MILLDYIFIVGILLLQIPPINIFSSITTHVLVRIIFFLLMFLYYFFLNREDKTIIKRIKTNQIIKVGLIFFLLQSLSLINSMDTFSYLYKYKDIVFSYLSLLLLFCFLRRKNNFKVLIKILVVGFILNVLFQSIIYFFPNIFISYGKNIFGSTAFNNILININRQRINYEAYDESLIPVFIYFLLKTKRKKFLIYFLLICFFSIVSGYRIRFITLIFSILASITFVIKSKKQALLVIFVTILCVFLIYMMPVRLNTIERIISPEENDYSTLISRIDLWRESFKMGMSNIWLGVGLGNIYNYLPNSKKYTYSLTRNGLLENMQDPHNIMFSIFSETGLLSLFSYIYLLLIFLKKDFLRLIKKRNLLSDFLIISFWSLFLLSLVTPTSTIKYYFYFWSFRALIELSVMTGYVL